MFTKTHQSIVKTFGVHHHAGELEGILRPPLELCTAMFSTTVAVMFYTVPDMFLMSPLYGGIAGTLFLAFGFRRYCQGMYVRLYQKYLSKPPKYKADIVKIEKRYTKKSSIFAGRGFKWRPAHTQRFYDLETDQDFNKLLKDVDDPLGGKTHLHAVGLMEEKEFWLKMSDRMGHVLIYGQSGSGKSRVLEIWLEQDIKAGRCVFLCDPKGDKDLIKRTLLAAARAGRLQDVVIFHLGFPDQSVRYNPIGSFQRISEVAGRLSDKLPSTGDSQVFAQFAWRFIYIVAQALEALGENITLEKIKMNIQGMDHLLYEYSKHYLKVTDDEFQRLINKGYDAEADVERHLQGRGTQTIKVLNYFEQENINYNNDPILADIIKAFNYEQTYYSKLTASLLPFLEQLTSLGDVTDPDKESPLPELKIQEAIEQNKIVIFGLDGLSDPMVAHAMGAMFFADIVSAAGKMYKEKEKFKDVIIHADEFNDVVSDDFMPLSNKSRGAGIILHAYTQTDQDIEVGLKDKPKSDVVKGNFNTVCCMKVKNVKTAEFFTDGLSEVNVKYTTTASTHKDSTGEIAGSSAGTNDEIKIATVPLVEPSAVVSQAVGSMFVSKNGGNIYHTRFPLIDEDLSELVFNIEEYPLGDVIRDVNLGTFKLKCGDFA
jgi:conjugative coupling factor TraD (SXT/TOL subfamily)